jgi:predicted ATP-binding protein involved in virulence
LFGQFDYTIALDQEKGIAILTGPNGYGKTTILNIIYNFFKQNFFFFQRLIFESITFKFENNRKVVVTKKNQTKNVQVIQNIDGQQRIVVQKRSFVDIHLDLKDGDKSSESYVFNAAVIEKLFQNILRLYPPMQVFSHDILIDSRTGNKIGIEDFLLQIPQKTIDIVNGFPKNNEQLAQLISILSTVDVFLIREQRLLRPLQIFDVFNNPYNNMLSFSYTIENFAIELVKLIHQKQAKAFQESQKLDNTFPRRLMQNEKSLSPDEFDDRFKKLTERQQQLQQFGITISNIQVPEYNNSKADVLSVYLDDAEKKTAFFDDLVNKIDLFVTIINEKNFAHKKININSNSGFCFKTDSGKDLHLTALSSGEQEEVVLLYELLFRTRPNTLVLIDEPETSLHVVWQKVFIDDLLAIAKVQPISFLLATHSPQIINGRWDMTTDLFGLINGEERIEDE